MRWTDYWRTVLSEIAQGSADALKRLVNQIPARAINRPAGLALMWIGRCTALLIAIFALGIWLFGDDGWWGERSFSGVLALFLAALYLPPAFMLAAIGKKAYQGKGDWRWLAILLALWVVALVFAVQS
jgi:hypothetical protein